MHKIDIDTITKLIKLENEDIKQKVNYLIDYNDYCASIEEKIKELNLNTKMGIFMAGQYDSNRREKHDIAINTLKNLNDYCMANDIGKLYDGTFNDENRAEIAHAIMTMCEELF